MPKNAYEDGVLGKWIVLSLNKIYICIQCNPETLYKPNQAGYGWLT
jgi:hypothetical protein